MFSPYVNPTFRSVCHFFVLSKAAVMGNSTEGGQTKFLQLFTMITCPRKGSSSSSSSSSSDSSIFHHKHYV